MNFFMTQSLGTYTKNMEMKLKWQQKKKNNNFTADGSTKLTDPIAQQAEEIRKAQADGSAKISAEIRTKLANGKKLTREEMEYLQKNDPQTYQKAKSLEAERESYERDLERCKTKEDVERVKLNRTAASMSVVKSVENNSAIPDSAKMGLMMQELMKNKALEETINSFIASGRYAQLPTEAEKLAAEKALKEAQNAELGMDDPSESTEEKAPVENGTETNHTNEELSADNAKDTEIRKTIQTDPAALQEHKMTRIEAETTPEALKVKRAKVQAAYKKNQVEIPNQIIDLKAE